MPKDRAGVPSQARGETGPRRGEIRAAADHMLRLMDDVRRSEEVKRTVPLGSDAFVELALRVANDARVVSRWADLQLQLAQSIPQGVEHATIADEEPRQLEQVLALWREAQIRLELAVPGSAAAAKAVEDIERLRNEYQAGFELRDVGEAADVEMALRG
jgi:hypothetical protein